jgi:hypothetical protein
MPISAICLCDVFYFTFLADGISALTNLISCGQQLRKSIIYKQNVLRLELSKLTYIRMNQRKKASYRFFMSLCHEEILPVTDS